MMKYEHLSYDATAAVTCRRQPLGPGASLGDYVKGLLLRKTNHRGSTDEVFLSVEELKQLLGFVGGLDPDTDLDLR